MSRLATVLFGPTTEADERHLGNILRQDRRRITYAGSGSYSFDLG